MDKYGKTGASIRDLFNVFGGYNPPGRHDSPDLGPTAALDMEPGLSPADSIGTMFVGPDMDTPAVESNPDTVLYLLRCIERNTKRLVTDRYWIPWIVQFPAAAGEMSIRVGRPIKNVFVHSAPRQLTIYAGSGKSFFLGSINTGQSLRCELPFEQDGITIVYATSANIDQQTLTFSSEKFDVEII